MSELELNLGGEPFRMKRENTFLYTFIGMATLREGLIIPAEACDHIFFTRKRRDDGAIEGTYLFKKNPITQEPHPRFAELRSFMEGNQYTMHLNLREVAESDKDALLRYYLVDVFKEFNNLMYVPEEWEK